MLLLENAALATIVSVERCRREIVADYHFISADTYLQLHSKQQFAYQLK